MATGGRVANKHQKVQSKKKGRNESDEDYTVDVYEFDESDDEAWYSLVDDGAEASLEEFEFSRSRGRRSCRRRIGTVKLRKKKAAYCADRSNEKPRKGTGVSYREGEDSDLNDSDKDEEFRPDDRSKWRNQKRKLKNLNRTSRKRPKKEILRRNYGGIGKSNRSSDSDSATSRLSKEREERREATEIRKNSTADSPRMTKEEEIMPSKPQLSRMKGKERMVDIKLDAEKQVCGICLSEKSKRTVRGILNSCIHYFCFTCIMEWSKVESRCPLCKQRFTTITRTARVVSEHNPMGIRIPIPERDQVYQPSTEELRGYLDPYEDVVCTECNEGGDDALLLLCDLCDSSAHTYCVGLGCEVPEGNWYCVACRPTTVPSSNELTPYCQDILPYPSQAAFGSLALAVSERWRIQHQIHHFAVDRQSESSDTIGSVSRIGAFGSQNSWSSQVLHHEADDSLRRSDLSGTSRFREGRRSCTEKEFVQSMVRSHLGSLSRDSDLGYFTFKHIARSSTHTILAAFGLEHRRSEVYTVQIRPLLCHHRRQTHPLAGQCYYCLEWFIRNVVREIMSYFKD